MFLDTSDLEEIIRAIPFPGDVKVRIFITGLCYCELAKDRSEIHFLRHVNEHQLSMFVLQRVRGSAARPKKIVDVDELDLKHQVLVSLEDSKEPRTIKETTGYPALEKTVNSSILHSGVNLDKINPIGKPVPSGLSLVECSFYTFDYFDRGCFEFRLADGTGAAIQSEIGFILGGNIRPGHEHLPLTVDYREKSGGTPTIIFPGMIGADVMLYDVVFINNCTDLPTCKDDVATLGGTDFAFYYQVLKEMGSGPGKQYFLHKVKSCPPVVHKIPRSDLAACNPFIKSPHPDDYDN